MGYFPNGTSSEFYFDEFCARCIHNKFAPCPVWAAHLFFNYDECNNEKSILHMLIPRADDGVGNKRCALFVDEELLPETEQEAFHAGLEYTDVPQ